MIGNAAQWRKAKVSRAPAVVAREALEAGRREVEHPTRAAEHAAKRYAVRASHNGRAALVLRDIIDVQQHFHLPEARVRPRIWRRD